MDKNSRLSDKEAALIAAAKRELAAAGAASTAGAPPAAKPIPAPVGMSAVTPAVPETAPDRAPQIIANRPERAIDPAERMAQLLAAQAEEHRRRDKKLKLYLLAIPLGVLVLAFLWVLLTTLPKLR